MNTRAPVRPRMDPTRYTHTYWLHEVHGAPARAGITTHAIIRWQVADAERVHQPGGDIGRIITDEAGTVTLELTGPLTVANQTIRALELQRGTQRTPAIIWSGHTVGTALAVARALVASLTADAQAWQTKTHPYSTAQLPYGGTHHHKGENW